MEFVKPEPPELCKSCKAPLQKTFNFCPNCGKQIHEQPVSLGKQTAVYAISFLLPPLGLFPGIRYLFHKDKKTKIVGVVAILLTVISFAITFWVMLSFFSSYSKLLNGGLNNYPIDQYQNLGL